MNKILAIIFSVLGTITYLITIFIPDEAKPIDVFGNKVDLEWHVALPLFVISSFFFIQYYRIVISEKSDK